VEAGSTSVNHVSDTVTFDTAFDTTPVVLAQTASVAGVAPAEARVSNVDRGGFSVQLQEEEASGAHWHEQVDWIAFKPGLSDGVAIERRADFVGDAPRTLNFGDVASDPAKLAVLADLQSMSEDDTAVLQLTNVSGSRAEMLVREERSRDAETAHVPEDAGVLALEVGLISAWLAL